ncbi:hypothetical protein ABTO98_19245, partial [Acinetobacter baumannii]
DSMPASLASPFTRKALMAAVAASALALPLAPALAQLAPNSSAASTIGRAPASFADIVERVKPSVVSISVTTGDGTKVADAGKG